MPSTLSALNTRVDAWFRNHVILWWLVLAVVPGLSFAVMELALRDAALTHASILGVVFGGTFATVTVAVQRWRRE